MRLALGASSRNFADEEVLLLEGGTGVGKSLAYLAAADPLRGRSGPRPTPRALS